MSKFILCQYLALLICSNALNAESKPAPVLAEKLLFLDNGIIKIGIDRTKGASITYLSSATYPNNMVNIHDPGRLIQQSYYAGRPLDRKAEGQSPSWSPWTWNPIQGGGIGSWAKVTQFKLIGNHALFGETIPKLWDMPDEDADAIMRQWTSFEPNMPDVIVVRNQFLAKRDAKDRWGPAQRKQQEVPACYFTRNFDRFKSYLGDSKWRKELQAPGPPWGRTKPPLKAMACFNAEGQGIAIYSPTSGGTWNFGPHRKTMSKDPKGGPCVHVAPLSLITLGPKSTYEYRYWMIVGNKKQITKRLDQLINKHASEKSKLTNP